MSKDHFNRPNNLIILHTPLSHISYLLGIIAAAKIVCRIGFFNNYQIYRGYIETLSPGSIADDGNAFWFFRAASDKKNRSEYTYPTRSVCYLECPELETPLFKLVSGLSLQEMSRDG